VEGLREGCVLGQRVRRLQATPQRSPLRRASAAVKAKLKAPRLTVRTAADEAEDAQLVYVDVYYMLRDVETRGTCRVYVPDDALRQALQKLSGSTHIEFTEACRPTCPRAPHKPARRALKRGLH
jgi:hypothetical protein